MNLEECYIKTFESRTAFFKAKSIKKMNPIFIALLISVPQNIYSNIFSKN